MSKDKPTEAADTPVEETVSTPETVAKEEPKDQPKEEKPTVKEKKANIERFEGHVSKLQQQLNSKEKENEELSERLTRLEDRLHLTAAVDEEELPVEVKVSLKEDLKAGILSSDNYETLRDRYIGLSQKTEERLKAEQAGRVISEPSRTPPKDIKDKIQSAKTPDELRDLFNKIN